MGYFHAYQDGVDYVFVDHSSFHAYAREAGRELGPAGASPGAPPTCGRPPVPTDSLARMAARAIGRGVLARRDHTLQRLLTWRAEPLHRRAPVDVGPAPNPTPPPHTLTLTHCPAPPAEEIYGGSRQDIQFRCALLTKAALEAPWVVPCGGVPYGQCRAVQGGGRSQHRRRPGLAPVAQGSDSVQVIVAATGRVRKCRCFRLPAPSFANLCPCCHALPAGEDNLIFVANDWHTSLLPFYLQVGAAPPGVPPRLPALLPGAPAVCCRACHAAAPPLPRPTPRQHLARPLPRRRPTTATTASSTLPAPCWCCTT